MLVPVSLRGEIVGYVPQPDGVFRYYEYATCLQADPSDTRYVMDDDGLPRLPYIYRISLECRKRGKNARPTELCVVDRTIVCNDGSTVGITIDNLYDIPGFIRA